ncbi:hypothetical protein [Modestobacter sp. DSM 44400]|uniref:hypothetical protein n=1 Tax=Modestobacter sp. DSM 44400 TaxID=1550230 RepID=UPI000B819E04|nr:hypothetical protein [Modestobacter sp. DSM 44400]
MNEQARFSDRTWHPLKEVGELPGAGCVVVNSLRPRRAMKTPPGSWTQNYFPTFDNLRLSTKSAAELRFRPFVLASR